MTEGLTSETEIKTKNPLTAEHTIYRIGKQRVPSVTGIIGSNLGWKYPALLGWTRKMMRQGIDPEAVASEAGTIGTLVHLMIRNFLTGYEVQRSFFSEEQIKVAMKAFHGFQTWWEENKIEPIQVEWKLTHSRLRYGGTIDFWGKKGKKFLLADFKSSKAVFVDQKIQLAAYSELIKHRTGKQHECMIFHLNKETGQFTLHPFPDLKLEMEVFRACLKLERIHKVIG